MRTYCTESKEGSVLRPFTQITNPTIQDVAALAEVSVATVSRVINQNSYVSLELATKVRDAMVVLNYHPSNLARSLRRQQTQTIGILVPELGHPFFSQLAQAMEQTLFKYKYYCLICSVEEDQAKEQAYISMFLRQRVDGVIAVPTGGSEPDYNRLSKRDIPFVLVDRDLPDLKVNRVLCNNHQGAAKITRYLISLGHRSFAVVGESKYSQSMKERMAGVSHTLSMDPSCVLVPQKRSLDLTDQFELGYKSACVLLGQRERPTAIISLTDVIALGVIHAAVERGLRVPDDVSVTGFDDIQLAAYVSPSLTTVHQPLRKMGQTAAALLLAALNSEDAARQTVNFDTELKIRQSTAGPT